MSAAITTHPIDLIKVRMMLQMSLGKASSPIDNFLQVVKSDGLLGLYQGISASLLRQATYSMTRFGVYGWVKELLAGNGGNESILIKLGSGVIAGSVGAIVGNPADLTMVRMQADTRALPEKRYNYKSVFNGLSRIVKEEGVLELWRGSQPTVIRAMLVTSAQLGVYDVLKQFFVSDYKLLSDSISTHIVCSMGAGFVAAVVTNPVDLVKTRIMNQKSGDEYRGMADAFRRILMTEGLGGLYKGFLPNFLRLGPQTIMTFIFYEQYSRLYHRANFKW